MYLKAGDLVVCVSNKPNQSYQPNPWTLERLEEGAYYRVASYFSSITTNGVRMFGIKLIGVDHAPGHAWQAWRFRKVVSADPSFNEAINRSMPKVTQTGVAAQATGVLKSASLCPNSRAGVFNTALVARSATVREEGEG